MQGWHGKLTIIKAVSNNEQICNRNEKSYYDEAVHWNTLLCGLSMMAVLLISAVVVVTAKNVSPAKTVKKQKKIVTKKGW